MELLRFFMPKMRFMELDHEHKKEASILSTYTVSINYLYTFFKLKDYKMNITLQVLLEKFYLNT